MVEGDLIDLTLPSLLQAMTREKASAVLRLQRGTDEGDQGSVFFCEGALVHALAGESVGDEAMYQLLGWSDGRFRLVRDADKQPRTITAGLANFITAAESNRSTGGLSAAPGKEESGDEKLLHDLLTGLSRLEQDKVRLEERQIEPGAVPALLLIATIVNSMVAVVTARCTDSDVLPSRVLPRLAEAQPYTQLLGEDQERISVATAAASSSRGTAPRKTGCSCSRTCAARCSTCSRSTATRRARFSGSRASARSGAPRSACSSRDCGRPCSRSRPRSE